MGNGERITAISFGGSGSVWNLRPTSFGTAGALARPRRSPAAELLVALSAHCGRDEHASRAARDPERWQVLTFSDCGAQP